MRGGSLDCLTLCLLKPKEKGLAGSSEAVSAGQLPDNPRLCLGATLAGVELTHLRMRPGGTRSLSVHLCLRLGCLRLEPLEMLAQGVSLCPGPSSHPVALFSLGSRPVSSPLPGFFSLPGVLCLILGALLFLVLIILVTQLLRWRAERRGGLQGKLGTRESVCRQEMGQV